MPFYRADFPYEEIRDENEDYFSSYDLAFEVADSEYNIWSVLEDEIEKNGKRTIVLTYGPGYHYVNILGYVVTKEAHENETYFEEHLDLDE